MVLKKTYNTHAPRAPRAQSSTVQRRTLRKRHAEKTNKQTKQNTHTRAATHTPHTHTSFCIMHTLSPPLTPTPCHSPPLSSAVRHIPLLVEACSVDPDPTPCLLSFEKNRHEGNAQPHQASCTRPTLELQALLQKIKIYIPLFANFRFFLLPAFLFLWICAMFLLHLGGFLNFFYHTTTRNISVHISPSSVAASGVRLRGKRTQASFSLFFPHTPHEGSTTPSPPAGVA